MRNIIKIFTILLSLLLFSCQEDNIEKVETNSNESRKLNIWRFPVEQVLKHKPNIKKQLDNLKTLKTQAKLTSSTYDFSIEETDAQVIFDDNYTQYTFKVQRENPNDNVLENYICKVFNNGEVQQFLISYPYIENENGIVYDTQNITMQPITDNSLIINSLNARIGCVPEFVSVLKTYECENVPCSGDGHQAGVDCNCGVTANCTVAHTECNWVTTVVWGYNCPNGGIDSSTNDGSDLPQGGNSSTGNTTNPDDEIVTVPFINKNHIKNCDELAIDSQNQVFKDRMQSLEDNINDTIEKSFGLYNGSYATPSVANPSCSILFDGDSQNAGSIPYHISLKGTAHNHLADSAFNHIGTFSPNDLLSLTDIITEQEAQNSPVQIQEFVSYLVCNEGNYAFKVNNFDKLYDFIFMYANNTSYKNRVNKFYKDNKIKHGKPKQDQNIGFLKMIQKFDIGIDYYESDENFQNWEKLELNSSGNDIVKTPCLN